MIGIAILAFLLAAGVTLAFAMARAAGDAEAAEMIRRNEEKCVFCGATIPEGRMVCETCEKNIMDDGK